MNRYSGNFITIEGIDKSGKSTLINNLQKELGNNYEFSREPSNGKYGRVVQDELKSDDDPALSDFFLFLADRADHCNSLIGPKLDEGTNVICDRYNLSTFAYQTPVVDDCIGNYQAEFYISEVLKPWVIEPDMTLYINIPVEEALDRMDGDGEKFEKESRLMKAKERYDRFAEESLRIIEIDGTQSEEEIFVEALEYIGEE